MKKSGHEAKELEKLVIIQRAALSTGSYCPEAGALRAPLDILTQFVN